MKYQRFIALLSCAAIFLSASACGSVSPPSSAQKTSSSAESIVSEAVSSEQVSSVGIISGSASSTPEISSKKERDDNEWVAYANNKDVYKLHIKRKDGTEDKVIVNDIVLAPCVAGEWVYYISQLEDIYKVKLDGSQKTKAGNTDAFIVYNANLNKYHKINGSTSITAKYQDGYILYTCFQLKQTDEKKKNPPSYYKLDPSTDAITEVKEK